MASTTCWDCGLVSNMTPVEGSASVKRSLFRDRVMGCFRCDGCGALSIAIAERWSSSQEPLAWLAAKKNPDWKPQPPRAIPVRTFRDVPSEIAAAASEAYRCHEISSAYRAAALMARSVIEATAKNRGVTRGSLIDKIDAMSDLIRPHVRDGAHQVRLLGNEMAHGDFIHAVSREEAALVLTLMAEVLDDVYQSPARVARAQAAREVRREQEARIAAIIEGKALPAGVSPDMSDLIRAVISQSGGKVLPPAPAQED